MSRTTLKWVHWLAVALLFYFFLNEPEDVRNMNAADLSFHAGMGLILGVIALIWFVAFLRKGLVGRPGPKLPSWGKKLHRVSHLFLTVALPAAVLSGALAGVAAPYVIYAFDVLPINMGTGTKDLHDTFEEIHEIAFKIVFFGGIAHGFFHLWRQFGLRDHAMRMILPQVLHKWL